MSPNHVNVLCSQLISILEAGAPSRALVKQLKGVEQDVCADAALPASVRARLGEAVDGIQDFWTALEIPLKGRELDAVRYSAFRSIQALEGSLRRVLTAQRKPQPYGALLGHSL